MTCNGCQNKNANFVKAGFLRNEKDEREFYECCDGCGGAGPVYAPDVFWDGKPEENLADGPDGKPITFLSRGQKARYLKEKGIYEAGDSFHGAAFTGIVSESKEEKTRRTSDLVRQARKKVESMGKDVRRREVLKIIKESQRFL